MPNPRVTLPLIGLSCGGGGALSIERVIKRLPGVAHVYVNPATAEANVEYERQQISPGQIADAIRDLGYETVIPASPCH